jgi:outer membrane protein OmpA-like peptidoglycan-associated protein
MPWLPTPPFRRLLLAVALLGGIAITVASAERAADATAPTVGTGPSGTVRVIAPLSDGRFVIGGSFNSYNGLQWNNLAIINADGSLDTSFGGVLTTGNTTDKLGGGSSRDVYAVAVQSVSGVDKILVSTLYTAKFYCNHSASQPVCTQATQLLVRLNLDGSLDTSFNPSGIGPNSGGYLKSIQIQANSDILISGSQLTSYNGTASNGVALLNADGTLKTAVTAITNRTGNPVNLAIANTLGTLYYGPGSVALGGFYAQQTAGISTPATATTGLTYGTESLINTFVPANNGGMIVVGAFASQFGGENLVPASSATRGNCIGKYNGDGTLNNTFNKTASNIVIGCSASENGLTAAIKDAAENIVFAGYFESNFRLAKFDEAGSSLSKLTILNNSPLAMTNGGSNQVIVVGTNVTEVGKHIARIDTSSGVADPSYPAPNNQYLTGLDFRTSDGASITSVLGNVGTAINITAVVTPSTNVGTVAYSLAVPSDLPAGLSFDLSTGAFAGTPTTALTRYLTIIATSVLGTTSFQLYFNISAASIPDLATPIISAASFDSSGKLCVTFSNATPFNMVFVTGGAFTSASATFFASTSPACSSTATQSGNSVSFVAGTAYLVRVRVGSSRVGNAVGCPCTFSSTTGFTVATGAANTAPATTAPGTTPATTSNSISDEALTAIYTGAIPGVTKTDAKVYTIAPKEVAANSAISVLTPTQKLTMNLVTRTPDVCLPNNDDLVFLGKGQCITDVIHSKTLKVLRTLRTKVVGTKISQLRVGNAIATIAPIYFDFVSSKLNRNAVTRLKKIRSQISQAGSVLVVGHSGTINGNSRANIKLSQDRAARVVTALRQAGSKGPFSFSGVGASIPSSPRNTLAAQAKNRRVIIVLIP